MSNTTIKPNRSNISEVLFEHYISLIGRTVQEAINNPNWRKEWSISEEKYKEFKKYAIPTLKKVFKFNRKKAENTLNFFWVNYGIKIELDINNKQNLKSWEQIDGDYN
jgi:hypothetical protein